MKKILIYIIRHILKILIILKISIKKKHKVDSNYIEKELKYVESEIYDKTCFDVKCKEINNDLSIIIPVYNSEKYLEKCLNSILNQKTKYKYNVICVNDGSKDNSLEILTEYSKKYSIIKIINQENKGISGARNTGINNSNGKYIGFIDNDDYVSNDYVDKLLDRALKTDADIVKCNHVNYLNSNNKVISIIRQDDASIKGNMNEKVLSYKGFIWGGIFKRELFDKVRFPLGYWYEDMIMRLILMRLCKQFEYIDQNLYYYNLHDNNASKIIWKSNNPKCLDQFFLASKLIEYSKKIGIEDNGELYLILLQEFGNVLWLRTRKMKRRYRKEIFYLASSYIKNLKKSEVANFNEKYLSRSLQNSDFILWNWISIYIMLGVKYFGE